MVNRIVDPDEERAILALLDSAGVPYIHIPFREEEYAEIPWDLDLPVAWRPNGRRFNRLDPLQQQRVLLRLYRHKNNYVMNNNGARNVALEDGRKRGKWVLPWDGNCFVSQGAWQEIVDSVVASPEIPYHVVPMARLTDNRCLQEPGFRPAADEEPQLIFRRDSGERFNEAHPYGRRPKVEFLWRLGVPGAWDSWPVEPWDLACPDYSPDAGAWKRGGWVARLASGQPELENGKALVDRGAARGDAIRKLLDAIDGRILSRRLDPTLPVFVGTDRVAEGALREALLAGAEEALQRGPYSVVDKTTLPPSGNRHDYWHPAPYYWPNPLPIPGLPYVRRDGRRVPGTRLYEPLSDQYDRTRLQRLFDDTFLLALAFRESGDERYANHAAKLVRCWFIDPATAMTPHLDYAQVRIGHGDNKGTGAGIIEMKDLYYFLDAVRLLESSGILSPQEMSELRAWFGRYVEWLLTSEQGLTERARENNHGTYYDLQLASLATFLGMPMLLRDVLRGSLLRLEVQFTADGSQPHELKRTTTAHYCCFNLQGWMHLAHLAARTCGIDLWTHRGAEGQSLEKAFAWLLQFRDKDWPYQQIDEFDRDRFLPLLHAWEARQGVASRDWNSCKPLFHPHDGIRPFWQMQ